MGTGLAASAAHPRPNNIWVPPPPPGVIQPSYEFYRQCNLLYNPFLCILCCELLSNLHVYKFEWWTRMLHEDIHPPSYLRKLIQQAWRNNILPQTWKYALVVIVDLERDKGYDGDNNNDDVWCLLVVSILAANLGRIRRGSQWRNHAPSFHYPK